ncbi:hypothetical protein AURDEDRAFT_177774 [Auricularia subglabra TFB-10046 SS5]|nr:hypothetical protein AURDEDRAFT_177774 [Auricularia subglabra TFB-10046 SS5]
MCQTCIINFFRQRRTNSITGLFCNAFEQCPLCSVPISSMPVRPHDHRVLIQTIHKTVTVVDSNEDFRWAYNIWQARRKSNAAATLCYQRAVASGLPRHQAEVIPLGYISAFDVGLQNAHDDDDA